MGILNRTHRYKSLRERLDVIAEVDHLRLILFWVKVELLMLPDLKLERMNKARKICVVGKKGTKLANQPLSLLNLTFDG